MHKIFLEPCPTDMSLSFGVAVSMHVLCSHVSDRVKKKIPKLEY